MLIEVFPDQTTSSFVTGFVRDQHKLVVNTRKKLVQLFELHDEKNDIAQSQPEKLRQYEQQMKEFLVARGLDPEDYFP